MTLGIVLRTVVLVLLHLTLSVGLGLGAYTPDLMTLAVLLVARRVEPTAGALTGLGAGLLIDALNELSFGTAAVAMSVVGALGSMSRDFFVGDSRLFVVLYVGLGSWVADLLVWTLSAAELRGPAGRTLLVQAPLEAVYLALFAVLTWPLLNPPEPEWKVV